MPIGRKVLDVVRFPVVAWFLRTPSVTGWILACVVVLALLHVMGLRLIFCPFRASWGIQCPGCGLTRGCLALLRGDWGRAVDFHAFSPAFLLAGIVLAVGMAVPRPARDRLAGLVEVAESKTGLSMLFLAAVVIYGLTRIVATG